MCFGLTKYFNLERSKRKIQVEAKWHEGIFLGVKEHSETAVDGTPHGIVFSRSIRRVPKEDSGDGMLFSSIRGAQWELQPGAEGGVVNRVNWMSRLQSQRDTHHSQQSGNSCQDELTSDDQWSWRGTGTQTGVSGASMRDWD